MSNNANVGNRTKIGRVTKSFKYIYFFEERTKSRKGYNNLDVEHLPKNYFAYARARVYEYSLLLFQRTLATLSLNFDEIL